MDNNIADMQYLCNRTLSQERRGIIESIPQSGENILFVVAADLNLKSRYAEAFFIATNVAVYSVELEDDSESKNTSKNKRKNKDTSNGVSIKSSSRIPYSKVEKCKVKRNYGNAVLVINDTDGRYINFIRFSYKVASLFDAAANFVENVGVKKHGTIDEEMAIMEVAFERQFSFCPKCGRSLIHPGANCIYCQSKNKLIKKIGKYILPHKYVLIFCLLLSVATTAMAMIPPYMTGKLVDDVLPNRDLKQLRIVVAVLFASYLLQQVIGAFRTYMLRVVGDKVVSDLRADVYRHAQYLPMKFYDRTSTGSVINRISGDSANLQGFMLRITQEVVVQFFTMIGIIVIMLSMNWQLTLLSLIPVPFVVYGARVFGRKIRPFYRKIWRRWSAVTSILTDSLPGIRVIKSFANERRSTEEFEYYTDEWLKTDIKSARITIAFPHIVSFIITCGSLVIWGIGGRLVIEKPEFITAGLLVTFISYTSMFYGPLNFFANLNDSYQSSLAAAERILDIIDAEPESNNGAGNKLDVIQGKIEFRNVSFSYDRSKKTLSNINFVIEPGEIVGIVGTTGSGKSTIINLLMRFYDGYDGTILVDDVDIRDIDMEYYRGQIGYVQQEPMMFHDTIYNNIAYGVPDAHVEQVIHAADVANAHEFIARMPDAYDTILGERGTGLSGGERQRLSIARAVLKNPSILFFDEATASVDSETEELIQSAIERLIRGRTTIMIAHRLSTLRKANKIIVVDKGEIIEMGTPEELLAKKGKYWRLIQIQQMSEQVRKSKEEENFE